MKRNMKISQAKETISVNFPKSLAVFNLRTYRSLILNDTGSLIWNFCKKPRSITQIIKFLSCQYNLSLAEARKDVTRLISQLEEKEVIIFR